MLSINNEFTSGRLSNKARKAYSTLGSWFCTDGETEDSWTLLPEGPPPPPLPPRNSGDFRYADPRRFSFAIVCMGCEEKYATLQEARAHFRTCPSGRAVDVLCGHCEMRTSSWSAMCAHLNKAGTQKQPACKPEYRMVPPPRPEFRRAPQLLQPLALPLATVDTDRAGAGQKLQMWRSPPQLTPSPSREQARAKRRSELHATLLHWNRKHPGRVGLWTAGQGLLSIPLESTPPSGYRLPSK